jgi:hypothetical protein
MAAEHILYTLEVISKSVDHENLEEIWQVKMSEENLEKVMTITNECQIINNESISMIRISRLCNGFVVMHLGCRLFYQTFTEAYDSLKNKICKAIQFMVDFNVANDGYVDKCRECGQHAAQK